jgi:outer membrane biosynthesis protein TonB
MNFLTEKLGFDPELNRGFVISVVFHVGLFLFAWYGVPQLFQDELIAGAPPGLEAVIVSDSTAAPKVAKESKKLNKPKESQKVEQPKKEAKKEPAKATPKPAASEPETAPEQQAVVIPDQTKPKEPEKVEKKPEEKQPEVKKKEPEPEKKKKKKQEKNEIDDLLKTVLQEPAAEPTPEKPTKNAAAEPDESSGPITEQVSEIPLTAGEEDGIRGAIEQRWNIPAGMANIEQYVVQLRLYMRPDGTISKVEVVNASNDPGYRTIAESARRAVLLTQQELGRLPVPADKYNSTIVVRWNMALVCSQMSC